MKEEGVFIFWVNLRPGLLVVAAVLGIYRGCAFLATRISNRVDLADEPDEYIVPTFVLLREIPEKFTTTLACWNLASYFVTRHLHRIFWPFPTNGLWTLLIYPSTTQEQGAVATPLGL